MFIPDYVHPRRRRYFELTVGRWLLDASAVEINGRSESWDDRLLYKPGQS